MIKLRYTEIDGKAYSVRCCDDCPFSYWEDWYYGSCNHPDIIDLVIKSSDCVADFCPLREVD